jgi:hypothetical protein
MSDIKLNGLLRQVTMMQLTGIFKNKIQNIGHLDVYLVTCIGNEQGKPNYDADYDIIDGSMFEVVSGNETVTFDFASEVKDFIRKHYNNKGTSPSRSIIL